MHTVDEKDLGCRPEHEAILGIAEKMDREKDAILQAHSAEIDDASRAIRNGNHERAAEIFDTVAKAIRAAGLPLFESEYWERRARDCREVVRRRAPKKGRKAGRK